MDYWGPKIASMFRTAFSSICFLLLFWHCKKTDSLPYYNTPDFTPHFIENSNKIEKKIKHKISDFEATDQNAEKITLDNLKGKVHIANFMFTRCSSICPTMTNNLKKVADAFQDESQFVLLSFSVTPWMDSIPALRSFTQSYGIKAKNWFFLTGGKKEIYRLARRSYFAEKDLGYTKDSTEFLHTEHVVLVDSNFRLRGIYNATLKTDILQLNKDITLLLGEK